MKKRKSKPVSEIDACLRIVDANVNRAKEAIRVCEDIVRFRLEDRGLTQSWKQSRHNLTSALKGFPVSYLRLLASRGADRDVGSRSQIQDVKKVGVNDLLAANMKRSQEALRVLEEFSKIAAPRQSRKFQKIRFQLYDLEKRTAAKL